MYSNNNKGGGRGRSQRSGGGGRGRFKGKRSFGGGNRGGGRNKRSRHADREFSDVSRFINKAEPQGDVVPYDPTHTFSDFTLDERLKKNVLEMGYEHPTPIQDQSIPHVLEGRDVVGIANTGTGKTAAFVIPLLNKVLADPRQKILIIAPTRELAIQIDEEHRKLSRGLRTFSVCAVGGMPIFRQIKNLRLEYNFVVGTPGRLKDLVERNHIRLNDFQTIVLDEADRMLDMGFIGDMRYLMAGMPEVRHTLFFSATLSSDIKKLISEFLNDPVSITVKTGDTAKGVDQDVVYVKDGNKIDTLHDLLAQPDFSKVLVFGKTKRGVEKLSNILSKRGFKSTSIHGNKNHGQRQRALKQFKEDAVNVLVATDVAARGLDIPDVTHVINYELPSTYEDYIHRVGRTGRGGKTGKALTFVNKK